MNKRLEELLAEGPANDAEAYELEDLVRTEMGDITMNLVEIDHQRDELNDQRVAALKEREELVNRVKKTCPDLADDVD